MPKVLLEFYKHGDDIPPLYDYQLNADGRLLSMSPPPRKQGMIQVVLERGFNTPSPAQLNAMYMLINMQDECECAFYGVSMDDHTTYDNFY